MDGRSWPQRGARRPVRMPRFSKPIKSNIPWWNRGLAGSSTRRPSARVARKARTDCRFGDTLVISLLVYCIIPRQVRLYLHTHDQQAPGNKGMTATPRAVVVALFAQVVFAPVRDR